MSFTTYVLLVLEHTMKFPSDQSVPENLPHPCICADEIQQLPERHHYILLTTAVSLLLLFSGLLALICLLNGRLSDQELEELLPRDEWSSPVLPVILAIVGVICLFIIGYAVYIGRNKKNPNPNARGTAK